MDVKDFQVLVEESNNILLSPTLVRLSLQVVLKIAKLMLTTVGYAKIAFVAEACQPDSGSQSPQLQVSASTHNQAVVLQHALQHIPNPNAECVLRNVAVRLGRHAAEGVSKRNQYFLNCRPFLVVNLEL